MDDEQQAYLYQLAQQLRAHGFNVAFGIVVTEPTSGAHLSAICGPRPDDDDRTWFFSAPAAPLAEAERVIDAAMAIKSQLRSPS